MSSGNNLTSLLNIRMSKSGIINAVLFVFCILSLYYYSYRYIFQYNSTSTSPTYGDTPFAFQAAKYFIAGFLLLITLLTCVMHTKKYDSLRLNFVKSSVKGFILLVGIFFSYAFLKGIALNVENTLKLVFFIPFIFFLSISYRDYTFGVYAKLFRWFLFYALFYFALQIVLFFVFDRLPALAYRHTYSVRFGGAWDDPNSFGMFLVLPIFYYLDSMNKNITFFNVSMFFMCTAFILCSQSLTAMGACAISLVLYLLFHKGKSRLVLLSIIGLSIALFFLFNNKAIALFDYFVISKQGSIIEHLGYIKLVRDFFSGSFATLLFGLPYYAFSENNYAVILTNFGLVGLFLAGLLMLFITLNISRKYINRECYENCSFISAVFYFNLAYFIGSFNLPFWFMFPVNYIYFLVVLLCLFINRKTKFSMFF